MVRLCSACLLGARCRYDGQSAVHDAVVALAKTEQIIPVCPEQLGGLPTPRAAAERVGAQVMTRDGGDVTAPFVRGAEETLCIARLYGATGAILKQRSPSCGCGKIYDGTFTGTVIEGDGVTAALLKKNGIAVVSEEDL